MCVNLLHVDIDVDGVLTTNANTGSISHVVAIFTWECLGATIFITTVSIFIFFSWATCWSFSGGGSWGGGGSSSGSGGS